MCVDDGYLYDIWGCGMCWYGGCRWLIVIDSGNVVVLCVCEIE